MNEIRPEATTSKGTFVGVREENGIISFRGIPFARPPVGRLRWQTPQEMPDSRARFDSVVFSAIPVQSSQDERYRKLPKSEDCLYLNVYTVDLVQKQKPVLVWVYGGAYVKGGASHPLFYGDLMIAENPDVILVTVNYRLGIFANLNLSQLDNKGDYRCSNNLAQLDLQAALKWVHQNIEAFGGNPDNVTVFGHSAGSSNISAQLMMAESCRYFNKAIMHSSFALDIGTATWEDSLQTANRFFQILGNPDLETLLGMSAAELQEAQEKLQQSGYFSPERKAFSVVMDGIIIPEHGFEQICNGSAAGIDVIIGTCCGEYDSQFRDELTEDKYDFLKRQCGKKVGDLDLLVRFYRENNPGKSLDEIYMDIKNDLWLRVPANLLAEAIALHSRVYMFYNMLHKENGNRAHHGNEYEMMFCRPDQGLVSMPLAYRIRQQWLNFVRGGEPKGSQQPAWEPYERTTRKTLVIQEQPYIAEGIRLNDMDLLYPLFREADYLKNQFNKGEERV